MPCSGFLIKYLKIIDKRRVFAAVATLESKMLIQGYAHGMPDLSEEQLVGCSREKPDGCGGGFASAALAATKAGYITTEAIYPYKSTNVDDNPATCSAKHNCVEDVSFCEQKKVAAASPGDKVTLTDCRFVATKSASALMQARAPRHRTAMAVVNPN